MQLVNIVYRKPYLINIKLGNDVIKEGVQIIEQFHNLIRIIYGSGSGGNRKEEKNYLKSCA